MRGDWRLVTPNRRGVAFRVLAAAGVDAGCRLPVWRLDRCDASDPGRFSTVRFERILTFLIEPKFRNHPKYLGRFAGRSRPFSIGSFARWSSYHGSIAITKNDNARRVIVVTVASVGLGRATVKAFTQTERARIGLIARGKERLEAAKREVEDAGGEALILQADVADASAITRPTLRTLVRGGLIKKS